jgi:uncharacterized protein (TIGR02186 family)
MKKQLVGAVLVSFLLLSAAAFDSHCSVSLTVNPDRVTVGAFYHGTDLAVTADAPHCDAVVLMLESAAKRVVLSRKGRLGVIWMNVAQVTVNGAPEVYILASSDDVGRICSREQRNTLGIGFDALESRMEFSSNKPLTGKEFEHFLKLKTNAGTYRADVPVVLRPEGEGRMAVAASIPLPSAVPVGHYNLVAYCFEGGRMIEKASASVLIEKTGLARLEYELAHEHAAAYGVIAVLVAMVAGITMGVAFTSRGRQSH